MPTVIQVGASSNAYATNEKPIDMRPMLIKTFPALTPLTVLTAKLGTFKAKNTRVDWTEDYEVPTTVGLQADGSTTLTIANYTYLRKGDLLFVPRTKELIRVSATPSSVSVTVVRGIGDTTEATIYTYDTMHIISPSIEEAEDSAGARQVVAGNFYNYTQIVNHFIHTTKTTMAEENHFDPIRIRNQAKMWREYKVKLEKNLLFSYRASAAGTSYNYRTMGGIVERLATGSNHLPVPGVLTQTMLDNWLVDVWTQRSDAESLTLIGSPKLIQIITQFAAPAIRVSPNVTEFGLPFLQRYNGAVAVDLIPHPLLSTETTEEWGFLLDTRYIDVGYLRSPVLLKNTYTQRAEYVEDKIESEVTMVLADEVRHGFISGVTS
jgi:hypothetical protein